MTDQLEGQMSLFDLDTWFGKTCPEPCLQITEKTSERSLKKPQKSATRMPLFLDLRKNGGGAGCIVGERWSIAWRIHDAQFWGVPQRRKRIALVADFGGFTAPEVLFVSKSVFGDIESSGTAGKGTSTGIEGSPGSASLTFKIRGGGVR